MPTSTTVAQDVFLTHFEANSMGIQATCDATKIKQATVASWRKRDTNGFRAKFTAANERRLDELEERMFAVIDWATQPDNFKDLLRYPTLLMFALKAGRPMYRDSVQVATGAADLISAITKLNDTDGTELPETSNLDEDPRGRPIPLDQKQSAGLSKVLDGQLKEILGSE